MLALFVRLCRLEGHQAVAGKQIDGLPRFIVELDLLSGHQRATCRS